MAINRQCHDLKKTRQQQDTPPPRHSPIRTRLQSAPSREVVLSYPSLCQHQKFQPQTIRRSPRYEISQASKRPLVHLDYDATACYDRIILPMASLIS